MQLQSLPADPDSEFLRQVGVHVGVAALTVADALGLYAALRDGPAAAEKLARDLNLNPHGVAALCAVLCSEGMLRTDGPGRFALSDLARIRWLPESPFYGGAVLAYRHNEFHHKRMLTALQCEGGDDEINAMWEAGEIDHEGARAFSAIMYALSLSPSLAFAGSGVFNGLSRVIDVGAGSGIFCAALSAIARTEAVVMDIPAVCDMAVETMERFEGTDKVSYAPCDFFRDPWPEGGDAYSFCNILHAWPTERAAQLLSSAYAALPVGGQVFVMEILMDEDRSGPPVAAQFDMMMFLTHNGRQFTLSELRGMVESTGFSGVDIVHRFGDYALLRGVKG